VSPQLLVEGVLNGAMIGLGAIGLTLTYSILRFANFAHGEFMTWGAYLALVAAGAIGAAIGGTEPLGMLTFGWPLIAGLAISMALTGALALLLDLLLFRRLRRHGTQIVLIIASFGASLALRSLLEFAFGPQPAYYSREIAMTIPLGSGVRATEDQLVVLGLAVALMGGCIC
jgi:branched-chain amino acid transport system permease protein